MLAGSLRSTRGNALDYTRIQHRNNNSAIPTSRYLIRCFSFLNIFPGKTHEELLQLVDALVRKDGRISSRKELFVRFGLFRIATQLPSEEDCVTLLTTFNERGGLKTTR